MIFRRDQYSSIVITLTSDEPLGIFDSEFIEDASGLDGYLTLLHVTSNQRWQMPMTAVHLETPGTANDVFTGSLSLSSLPDGAYQVLGRVRDLAGNHTTLTAGSNSGDRVITLEFSITSGDGAVLSLPGLVIRGAYNLGGVTSSRTLPGVIAPSRDLGEIRSNNRRA
jgi:hypothetical protein